MPTEILAVGETQANSSDVVVDAGDQLTVALKDAAPPTVANNALVDVQLKDDDNNYFNADIMDSSRPALVIGAGTWRFSRRVGGSCGVFSA